MVEIYNSTRLLLDNCEMFLYRKVKLSENELLTIWLCINHVVLGRGGGGGGTVTTAQKLWDCLGTLSIQLHIATLL